VPYETQLLALVLTILLVSAAACATGQVSNSRGTPEDQALQAISTNRMPRKLAMYEDFLQKFAQSGSGSLWQLADLRNIRKVLAICKKLWSMVTKR
jgi:hypothetical protein